MIEFPSNLWAIVASFAVCVLAFEGFLAWLISRIEGALDL